MNQLWLRITFAASILLNVFLIGAAAGILALGARVARERPAGPGGPGQFWRASQVLPPPDARAFRQQLRARAESIRPQAEAAGRARREAWLTGAQPAFDAAAVKAALARARNLDMVTRQSLEDAVVDAAAALPTDQRRAVFRAMSEPRRFRGGPMRRPPPDGGPSPGPDAAP